MVSGPVVLFMMIHLHHGSGGGAADRAGEGICARGRWRTSSWSKMRRIMKRMRKRRRKDEMVTKVK